MSDLPNGVKSNLDTAPKEEIDYAQVDLVPVSYSSIDEKYPNTKFSKSQRRILEKLSDGKSHKATELLKLFPDTYENKRSILTVSISFIRVKIAHLGEDIICEVGQEKRTFYKHIMYVLKEDKKLDKSR